MIKTINTKEAFAKLLQTERAIVLIFFGWSSQAHQSLKVFQTWEQSQGQSNLIQGIDFFRIDPDDFRDCWNWLATHTKSDKHVEGGYGSTIWVRKGVGIGFAPNTAEVGLNSLNALTEKYFGQV